MPVTSDRKYILAMVRSSGMTRPTHTGSQPSVLGAESSDSGASPSPTRNRLYPLPSFPHSEP